MTAETIPAEVLALAQTLANELRAANMFFGAEHRIARAILADRSTRPAEPAYYAAITECLERYRPMAEASERRDLVKFIDQLRDEIGNRAPLYKLNRWLGYIQGVLIEIGCTDVLTEREWSRPLFRPLDFPVRPAEPAPEVEVEDGEVVASMWVSPMGVYRVGLRGGAVPSGRTPEPLVRLSTLEAERARADAAKAENEESYELGKRDGYEQAIQRLDELTGGDGEFVCVVGGDTEDRHCPDAASMQERIVARVSRALQDRDEAQAALQPFARSHYAEPKHGLGAFELEDDDPVVLRHWNDQGAWRCDVELTRGDFRRARLRADQPAGEGGEV